MNLTLINVFLEVRLWVRCFVPWLISFPLYNHYVRKVSLPFFFPPDKDTDLVRLSNLDHTTNKWKDHLLCLSDSNA